MNLEDKLVSDLENNEHIIHILPADELFQEWVYQFPSKAKDFLVENKDEIKTFVIDQFIPFKDIVSHTSKMLSDFGMKGFTNVNIKEISGKKYISFKGNPRLRKIITGTRYLVTNPKIVRMAIGPKGIQNSIKTGFVISAVLSVGIEILNYYLNDDATMAKLLGTIHGDLIKIGISSIAGAIAGAAAATATGAVAVIVGSTIAPFIIAVAVGVAVGLVLNEIDKNIGATQALIRGYEKIGIKLKEMEYEIGRTLYFWEKHPESLLCALTGYCESFDMGGITGY